jgi:hypothetical protein
VKPFPEFPDVRLMENKLGENVLFCKFLQDGKRKQLTKTISKKLMKGAQQEAVQLTCRVASELQAQLTAMLTASDSVQIEAESTIAEGDDADAISEGDGEADDTPEFVQEFNGLGGIPEVVEEYDWALTVYSCVVTLCVDSVCETRCDCLKMSSACD